VPLPLHKVDWTNKIYETEIRRLRALGLIQESVCDYTGWGAGHRGKQSVFSGDLQETA
jgi:hypothetical protein